MKKLNLVGLVVVGLIGCCSVVRADGTVTPPYVGNYGSATDGEVKDVSGATTASPDTKDDKNNPTPQPATDILDALIQMDTYGTTLKLQSYDDSIISPAERADYKRSADVEAASINKIPEFYHKLLLPPSTGSFALSNLLLRYAGNITSSMSAVQATQVASQSQIEFLTVITSQNQILIEQNKQEVDQNSQLVEQNKQIISLLTKIASKK